ncbi:MAG: metal-dependent transcriptional regulator [Clostridia bacterium]|nr:metal-dependent transcriptional regulator [Clostridia bacterium]
MLSKSLEEYLKNIYILGKQEDKVRVTDIAERMGCSKASVNKAVNNLKDEGLINYEIYGKIELTADGEELAKKIVEAYDIVFLFFKDVLNLDEDMAEVEAEKVKSTMSDEAINRLAKYSYEVLGLNSLNCSYDINKEKCRKCLRRTSIKERKK